VPQKTGIEWTDYSSNPFRARDRATGKTGHHCEKCSPGCANCYSEVLDGRFGIGRPYTQRETPNVEFYLAEKEIDAIIRHRKSGRCFVGDMTDLFGPWVPDEMLDDLFAAFHLNIGPDRLRGPLEFQILTKRPERMAAYIGTPGRGQKVMEAARRLAKGRGVAMMNHAAVVAWPLSNVWAGTSIEDQKRADERIPHLLKTPAAVRFLSVEPLLGPVDLRHVQTDIVEIDALTGDHGVIRPLQGRSDKRIHLVIVGGESGPGARPMHPDWARSLRDQCRSAGVAYFFKQFGEWAPIDDDTPRGAKLVYVDARGGVTPAISPYEPGCPCDHDPRSEPMVRLGKKRAGRLLDGREWNEFPQVPARCD
jgi:protein gp37